MKDRLFFIKIIGYGLATLYAASLWYFLIFIRIPEYKESGAIYSILFGALFIGSLAVVNLREWGRKLIVVLNVLMLMALVINYLPKVKLLDLSYLIMNVIVFLYFSQNQVKRQFVGKSISKWRSILVVDDDETLIKIVRPILISNGYSVLTANTGEDGLRVAQTQKPDLIILDVILPGIKGRDVCRKLKEDQTTKDIPIVFLTAKDSDDDIEAEMAAGAETHLTKPVNARILLTTIENVLNKKVKHK